MSARRLRLNLAETQIMWPSFLLQLESHQQHLHLVNAGQITDTAEMLKVVNDSQLLLESHVSGSVHLDSINYDNFFLMSTYCCWMPTVMHLFPLAGLFKFVAARHHRRTIAKVAVSSEYHSQSQAHHHRQLHRHCHRNVHRHPHCQVHCYRYVYHHRHLTYGDLIRW